MEKRGRSIDADVIFARSLYKKRDHRCPTRSWCSTNALLRSPMPRQKPRITKCRS